MKYVECNYGVVDLNIGDKIKYGMDIFAVNKMYIKNYFEVCK